jgi:hypothetical protein
MVFLLKEKYLVEINFIKVLKMPLQSYDSVRKLGELQGSL